MKRTLALTLLSLQMTGAQPAAPVRAAWPQDTCIHGTTVNTSRQTWSTRAVENTIRTLLQDAGVQLAADGCGTYLNVLVQADAAGPRATRVMAALILADREVNLPELNLHPSPYTCARTLQDVVLPEEDLLLGTQRLLTRLLADLPVCPDVPSH
ncbi:hypothetical protein LAJ19_19105 (plasmid) [Deinococcus taeanensis]|uniref:hypothetical protein n=1 Tax=Deinococcus taeanensis TaxID=2737050 RepID=UPI001CDD74CA|nr:hypothetical protein [Deinococcus taeanensis]UBV44899.1 hypothetical protein LAJ19_19105 [Deinococcus taeanensis]